MKKLFIFLIVAVCIAYGTFMYTIKSMHIDVYDDQAVVTVYGQMYVYDIYRLRLTGYEAGSSET